MNISLTRETGALTTMTKTGSHAAGGDLDRLDAFLLSDRAPENSMGLSDLDGFLTGIIVGPDVVPPAEWMPVIWGGEEPKFASVDEAKVILGTIIDRYNEIIANLDSNPLRFSPVFQYGPVGQVIVSDWSAGFLEAVSLRRQAWDPLIVHPEARSLIVPMFLTGAEEQLDPIIEEPLSAAEMERLLGHGEELITTCVLGIRAFWLEHGSAPSKESSAESART